MLAEKLKDAGIKVDHDRAYVAACETMAKTNDPMRAASVFYRKHGSDEAMMTAIIEEYLLRVVMPDMKSGRETGGGHSPFDARAKHAPDNSASNGSGAQNIFDTQVSHGTVISIPRDGGAKSGQPEDVSHRYSATPRPTVKPITGLATRVEIKRGLLDTLLVLDGRAIGDVRFYECKTLSARSIREGKIFAKIRAHLGGGVTNEDARLRDVISDSVLKRLIAEIDNGQ